MRFGYWLPVFGGWLRNVDDEGMEASWSYVRRLARRSEEIGFDLTLLAELNLNDIKGMEAPSLDAWSTAAALAAVTDRLELMVAVRPTFHQPALLAKQAANIDRISGGRLALNVVSSWWATEAKKYGVAFDRHDDRYARSSEWLDVVDGMWREPVFSFAGRYYSVEDAILEPKPLNMRERRAALGLPPMTYGAAGYVVVRDSEGAVRQELARLTDVRQSARGYANYRDWIENTQLEQRVSLEDYSVSNRGLKSGLTGTPDQVAERVLEFERAGLDLLLLQFSPQLEEMERFAEEVIPRVNGSRAPAAHARRAAAAAPV
jgi:FMNH2-dependent dimethyl sulfone monooxygenase